MVEVLKEELEEGRSASVHLLARFLEGKTKLLTLYFFQFGFIRRTGRL